MPNSKKCTACSIQFEVNDKDLSLLAKVSPIIGGVRCQVPAPSLCYDCRQQRRLSWRNERTLYRRKDDASEKDIVSIYSPHSSVKVYEHKKWYSESWDGLSYARAFDFSRPFFEQFAQLHSAVPLMSLDVKSDNENCDYSNLISQSKNCYQTVACSLSEDCLYCAFVQRSQNCVDCFFIFDCELCYQCIDCYRCYELKYSDYCQNCSDSHYLYNCRACSSCFGCVSLVNKSYHVFNQPVTPLEYSKLSAHFLKNGEITPEGTEQIAQLKLVMPQKYYAGLQNENVSGDHISYSKNSENCYDCTYLEDCRHCTWFHKSSDCMDCYGWGLGGELSYENHLVGNTFQRVLFCDSCWEGVSDLLYCRLCMNSSRHLLGCVGLRGREYCILNKQYSREEYQSLALRIISHMQNTGEWGEFFPSRISPFCYNESVANEYYELTPAACSERQLRWQENLPFTKGRETLSWAQLSADLPRFWKKITEHILACQSCGKNYKITSQELEFYQKAGLGLPKSCFNCRHIARRSRRNRRRLIPRSCPKCQAKILSPFAPDSLYLVYCEECYLKEVQ